MPTQLNIHLMQSLYLLLLGKRLCFPFPPLWHLFLLSQDDNTSPLTQGAGLTIVRIWTQDMLLQILPTRQKWLQTQEWREPSVITFPNIGFFFSYSKDFAYSISKSILTTRQWTGWSFNFPPADQQHWSMEALYHFQSPGGKRRGMGMQTIVNSSPKTKIAVSSYPVCYIRTKHSTALCKGTVWLFLGNFVRDSAPVLLNGCQRTPHYISK